MTEFAGFSKGTLRFFRSLKRNNSKEWFDAHRDDYEKDVLGPARAFVPAMGERLRTLSPAVTADPRVNGSLFRINRDTRFSPDKSPYKTHLGLFFWEGRRKKMECPGYYVHVEGDELMLGGGLYMFPPGLLESYRRAAAHPESGRALVEVVKKITSRPGVEIGGQKYKRVPAGYDADHFNAGLLRHGGLYSGESMKIPGEFFLPEFPEFCLEHFRPFEPLHRWIVDHLG